MSQVPQFMQIIIFALFMLGSFLGWLFKRLREQKAIKEARQRQIEREEMILRTGRDPLAEGQAGVPTAPRGQVARESEGETIQEMQRQAEMARRQEQLRQLRERRRQGQGVPAGPALPTVGNPHGGSGTGPVMRELWPGGPVIAVEPPARPAPAPEPAAQPQQRPNPRPQPRPVAQPSAQTGTRAEARSQQRQRDVAPAQDRSRDRLQRPERTATPARGGVQQTQQPARKSRPRPEQVERDDTEITERNRRAASMRSVDDSKSTGANRGRVVAAEQRERIDVPSTLADWRRALVINEILSKPLGFR